MRFRKIHGAGNDFVLLSDPALNSEKNWPKEAERLVRENGAEHGDEGDDQRDGLGPGPPAARRAPHGLLDGLPRPGPTSFLRHP